MRHPFLEQTAAGLFERSISSLRYQFRYMEQGSRRPDTASVAHAAVRAAVAEASRLLPGVALFAGGKSFGGRMTSQAQSASPLPGVRGLVFLGFPLHPPGRPSAERGKHLFDIQLPMLFLQGDRDEFAELPLLQALTDQLGARAKLRLFRDADHSFHVPARTGRKDADVHAELLDVIKDWIEMVLTGDGPKHVGGVIKQGANEPVPHVRRAQLMPSRASQVVQVGRRQVELSNLSKVLYPEDQISKAQVIEYYIQAAPTILAHLKGRPLSLLRYPEGIAGEAFFQKNRPDWAPEWIAHVPLGEEKTDYVIATEPASLVWLANLAGLELHQMHSRQPHFDKPDYIVFDLDPPERFPFPDLVGLALEFKEQLEEFGYHPFVKTTGRKGLHILTPIEPKWAFQAVFDAAKEVASPFVDSHSSAFTLQIKKEHRKGKVLLDIYRNRQAQTIIAAYSLRGLNGAPVSTPLHWEELEAVATPTEFNIQNVGQRLKTDGDPWEAIWAYATAIHTERRPPSMVNKKLPPSRTRKTAEQLRSYASKRSFNKTSEPKPLPSIGEGSAFVLHRHHATRLHYDLRLEKDGVLHSWAVPKGLPPRPGILRLAVRVEDHPLEYVNFEGVIPKGEYGGGTMWRFAQGRYEISKQKRDGFYFRLHSQELNGEYRIHHTKENQWLLERVDTPQQDWLRRKVEPMLAGTADQLRDSPDYLYEVKWDGIRAIVSLDEGELRIHGRNGMDLTTQFPELLAAEASFRATSGVFDGEIVCLDPDGKPNFGNVIRRMQQVNPVAIERARTKHAAVCYLFDCVYLDGRAVIEEPFVRRREWLSDVVKKDGPYRLSEVFEDGRSLLKAVREMGLEGIMAKKRDSAYRPGKRADSWLKTKTRQTAECLIIGYTKGKGDREATFGALHLASQGSDGLKYVGKVGTGFDDETLGAIFAQLAVLTRTRRPVKEKALDNAQSIWVEPKLMCEVTFASITPDGMLREPVFIRLRPDLARPDADYAQEKQSETAWTPRYNKLSP